MTFTPEQREAAVIASNYWPTETPARATHTPRAAYIPAYKVHLVRDSSVRMEERPQVLESRTVADLVRSYLGPTDREHFVVVLLDTKHRVIGITTVATGTIDQAAVYIREVFKAAILANAPSIVIAHNHPSGDPTPSGEDVRITRDIIAAGNRLGVSVLDHVIVGDGTSASYSFASFGQL